MIPKFALVAITATIAFSVTIEPVQASSASREASRECKEEMRDEHGADGFHDVSISHRGSEYKVAGYAERDDRHDEWFECWTRHGRVIDIDFDGWERSGSGDKGKAIAAGVALAAIVAAAASAKKHHDDHDDDYRYDSYNRNHANRDNQWHPARGVTCYKYTHQCYTDGGGYSGYWTNREFH